MIATLKEFYCMAFPATFNPQERVHVLMNQIVKETIKEELTENKLKTLVNTKIPKNVKIENFILDQILKKLHEKFSNHQIISIQSQKSPEKTYTFEILVHIEKSLKDLSI